MEVILAEYLGFCYGVKRAIRLARDSAAEKDASTLGPIIHNPQMVARLEEEGVGSVDTLDEVPDGGTLIIRSHGVGPAVYEAANARPIKVVDATCPHVKKAQMAAHRLAEDGFDVVIIGEKKHPEVKSILEWAGGNAAVVETEEEAEALPNYLKLGIVAQTTFSGTRFQAIAARLIPKSNDIRIIRTICTATDQRQSAALRLAADVDMMLVIGGKNSANTTRLAQICAEKTVVHHIETASELKDEWFHDIKKIGITAGASTPDWIIREVYQKCQM
ncbi:MAG: 4-hydroxy-3-methylbut-2-enyl diphosphate reductase [Schwartzia sp.]|jgi:4-hydroxy-3-methylbut-2-enyl diphosphate reductase|nr:4-hydroxy-3-methylbut-2-enyl diphosphate reductase [Schwartzia sp. (in: firmicutes)]MBQ9634298.1 4-hydroxy-3-methylbut-2-enyl diphosphate reductase [Schwartzia sp. (in: firmicutes)]